MDSQKQNDNPLLRPDHELPAPHDMLIEAEEKDGIPTDNHASNTPPEKSHKRSFPLWIFPLIALFIVLLAGGMYLWEMQQKPQETKMAQVPTPIISPTPDPMDKWKTFTAKDGTYSFMYPPYLFEPSNNKSNPDLMLCKCPPGSEYGSFTDSLSVYSVPEAKYSTIEKYLSSLWNISPQQFVSSNILVAETPAKRFTIDETITKDALLPTDEVLFIKNKKIFHIISIINDVDTEDFDKILASFKFISSTSATISQNPQATAEGTMVACTMDAKLCPDGSSVGRVGPKCEFAACPKN